jgi:hypothetical protein
MLLLLLVSIFLLCLYRIDCRLVGINEDYLCKDKTNSIKGIFIFMIVITHALPYIEHTSYGFDAVGDGVLMWFVRHLDQLIVVMFLFYSGFGIGESYKRKGQNYLNGFPRKRILSTLLNFDVAVIAFLLLALFLGTPITIKQVLFSFVGWESLGNSNWYIFVILLCYLFSYVSLRLPIEKVWIKALLLFVFCLLVIFWLSHEKGKWWYNTIMSYPMGFLYSSYKEPIERFLKKYYWLSCFVLLLLFVALFRRSVDRFCLSYNALSMVFALLAVSLTMKVSINNPPLRWAGEHLFPIYIYMRIPMIILEHKQPVLIANQPALFIIICLVVTMVIAQLYKHWQIKLD